LSNHGIDSWLSTVRRNSEGVFADVGKVCVGIKTTADVVFVRDDWDCLPEAERPEDELPRPLVTHHFVRRWHLPSRLGQGKRVLYPYKLDCPERDPVALAVYPRAKAYLLKHATRLKSRTYVLEAGREWYEIWVPQRPSDWAGRKIAFPDISETSKFFLVEEGWIVNGDCYWIKLLPGKDACWLELMLAVANSSLSLKFYDAVFHNKLYSGRRRFMSQYVSRFPLPKLDRASEVLGLVRNVLRASAEQNAAEVSRLEPELDQAVWRAFGLAEEAVR
jgi:adenine-specific DNA-methyltransferase